MKFVRECPVCLNEYSQLGKHLRQTHRVKNETERKILLKLGSGRTDVRTERCSVGGCDYQGSRLDRHIREIHSEMTVEERAKMMEITKQMKAIKELAALRMTDPVPAMATYLDPVDEETEVLCLGDDEAPRDCGNEECGEVRRGYVRELARLTTLHDQTLQDMGALRLQIQLLKRKLADSRYQVMIPHSRRARARREAAVEQLFRNSEEVAEEDVEDVVAVAEDVVAEDVAEEATLPAPNKEEQVYIPKQRKATSRNVNSPWMAGSGRGNVMRRIKMPPSMEEYLQNFGKLHEGTNPTRKMRENAKSKVSRVKTFILFMGNKHKRLSDWLFMDNPVKLKKWCNKLARGMQETTVEFYLKNNLQFLNYMQQTPPRSSRLTKVNMTAVIRDIKVALKSLKRLLVVHQTSVKQEKYSKLPGCEAITEKEEGIV
ncbi:uncharacterized protein LOC115003793 isoform X2 [Cottoperca gobio]|nr:uncharacterized protein LOC115003793 isoform X2 [Cottoperca gobio]